MVLTWGVWVGTREVYSPETVVTTYGRKWYPTHGGLEEKMHLYIISCSFRAVFFFKGSNWLGRSLLGRCPRAGSLSGNSPGNQLFWSGSSWHQSKYPIWLTHKMANINGTNILHQRERKLIFPTAFRCDMMLVPRRVYQICQMILSFRNAERSYPSNKKDFTQSTANIKNFYAQPEKKFHSQFLCCSLPSLSWGAFKKIT